MTGREVWVIGAVVLIVLLLALVGGGMMMGPGMIGCCGFGWSPLGWLVMLLFWVLIIGGLVALIAWIVRQGEPTPTGPGAGGARALEILRERYARGELTREQYEQMRRDLEER